MEKKYRFSEGNHLHQLEVDGEWKNLTGCTTILSVLAKPALIQWAANMAVEYIQGKILEAEPGTILDNLSQWISEAKKAHRMKKEKAGDWGTKLHAEVERYIKNTILTEGKAKDTTKYDPMIKSFIDWTEKNKVKFLDSEKHVWSERLWLGGIVDFICEIDGQKWIGDIKTSKSGIYPENFWQCAGYDLMLQEMGMQDIKGYVILNLKQTGDFIEKRSVSNGENVKAFTACLDIYRIQEKIKNQVI